VETRQWKHTQVWVDVDYVASWLDGPIWILCKKELALLFYFVKCLDYERFHVILTVWYFALLHCSIIFHCLSNCTYYSDLILCSVIVFIHCIHCLCAGLHWKSVFSLSGPPARILQLQSHIEYLDGNGCALWVIVRCIYTFRIIKIH